MFDHNDIAQHAAVTSLETGARCAKRFARSRLARTQRPQAGQFPEPAVRDDTTLVDLHGLPERTIRVAELLASGARWGEVEVALGISRRELDAERHRLALALS